MGNYVCKSCGNAKEADSAPECCGALMEEKKEEKAEKTQETGEAQEPEQASAEESSEETSE